MLDTLLASFPKGSLVAIIGDPAAYIADPHVCLLPSDRSILRAHMQSLHCLAQRSLTSIVVVYPAASTRPEASIYSIPMDIGARADVVICPHETGSYTVLKNRFGRANYCVYPIVPTPEPPDLTPESSMTNDDINASSEPLPFDTAPEQTARFMATVYAWMGAGVATSAAAAYLVAANPATHAALTTGVTGVSVTLATFALICLIGYFESKERPYLSAVAYLTLTALYGVMLSSLAVLAAGDSALAGNVAIAFVVSAGMFAGLATFGWATRRDLSGWGTFLLCALLGLLLAMGVNIFVVSSVLQLAISSAGVLLFSALIAYDTQRAKKSAHLGMTAAVNAALDLYLDFLNLFLIVLRMLGIAPSKD